MLYLPLRKMPRGSDSSLANDAEAGECRLRSSGRKAFLASTTWSEKIRAGSMRRDRDHISTVTPAGSVLFCRGARQFDRGVLSVPWRFSDAGIPACWLASSLPASENLYKTFAASRRNGSIRAHKADLLVHSGNPARRKPSTNRSISSVRRKKA